MERPPEPSRLPSPLAAPREAAGGPTDPPATPDETVERCDWCGSADLWWRNCKLLCRSCSAIVKSCADL